MYISLINFVVNVILFLIIYLVKQRISKFKKASVEDEKKINSSYVVLFLGLIIAGLAWYLPTVPILNLIASLISLTGVSIFFNTTREWFKKTQPTRIKKEDFYLISLWCMWLLSGSIFLANIMIGLIY